MLAVDTVEQKVKEVIYIFWVAQERCTADVGAPNLMI